ncbi:MAG TPA: GAF domain-containing protein [Gammaproteobacteria bacterium]|nr:GAF domain-containing protein [Gammaproteobacteria bacterium]
MTLTVDAIRECLEGAIPAVIATCASDGTPNVSHLSQVQYVDSEHVALSYQFFNKTRQNVLADPRATVLVAHPATAARYRMRLRYLRTETSGPLFENMKAKLAGIASHTGMSGVFRLLGADVYRVLDVETVPGDTLPPEPPRRNMLSALRACAEAMRGARGLDELLDRTLEVLDVQFRIPHSMALLLDAGGRLYTVASRGYDASGVGSEIPLGQGVIGVAARERTPIRIGHMTAEYTYSRAIRASATQGGMADMLETEIPLPGLPASRSQLAVPIVAFERVLGVLYVESERDLRFSYDDEDALVSVAGQLGGLMHVLQSAADAEELPAAPTGPADVGGPPVTIRHYAENDSVFLDDDYLIKGVAGAIFWALVNDCVNEKRTTFSNRELRLDRRIRLPDISDNLEARLILLQRRLVERNACVQIEKTGRGRFRLRMNRPLKLEDVRAGTPR